MRIFLFRLSFAALCIFFTACQTDPENLANQVPIADAGPTKTVVFPNTVTLTGTGTDRDGTIKAYLWSQVSGPAPSVIANPGNMSTLVTLPSAGNYLFQLMVTDDQGATGVDTSTVISTPKPLPDSTTLTLQPNNNTNEFVIAIKNNIDQSSNTPTDIPVETWTVGGDQIIIRSLIKFDLSSIPQTATILSANLYMYSFPTPTNNGNFVDANYGSNNAMLLQQAGTNWSSATVGWNNQPAGITASQISIAHTTASNLDLNLDVKNMVSSMVSGNANYGFLFKLQNEAVLNSRIFVSSRNTVHVAKHPKLVVVYR